MRPGLPCALAVAMSAWLALTGGCSQPRSDAPSSGTGGSAPGTGGSAPGTGASAPGTGGTEVVPGSDAAPPGVIDAPGAGGTGGQAGATDGPPSPPVCPPGQNLCFGRCAAATDVTACGPRCQSCLDPSNGKGACDGTACRVNCNLGFHLCDGLCRPEVEPCRNVCADGLRLCNGRCSRDEGKWCCDDNACQTCEACTDNQCIEAPPGGQGRSCSGNDSFCLGAGTCGTVVQQQLVHGSNWGNGMPGDMAYEQTLTIGRTGSLRAIRLMVWCNGVGNARVEVRNVGSGSYYGAGTGIVKTGPRAGNSILASATLDADQLPGFEQYATFTLPSPLSLAQGQTIALVVRGGAGICTIGGSSNNVYSPGVFIATYADPPFELDGNLCFQFIFAP